MKFWCKLIVLLTLVLTATAVFGNNYPYPGKNNPVDCTVCPDEFKNLPTYPYHDPIVSHAGRFIDSARTVNVQHIGMRTTRARQIRTNFERGRLYLQLGETVASYKLDTFFTQVLKQPMVLVSTLSTGEPYGRYSTPIEKIAAPDSFHYPEAKSSGWKTVWEDHQVNLNDFDSDDRGYVYVGNLKWGWGIARDINPSGGRHMEFVSQTQDSKIQVNANTSIGVTANTIISLRVGNRYYASIADNSSNARIIYDVTNPAAPVYGTYGLGLQYGIMLWSKHDESSRLAVVTLDGALRIYDYATFVAGGAPIVEYAATKNKKYADVAFDDAGRLWVAEGDAKSTSVNDIWKLSPSGTSYTKQTYSPYGTAFSPSALAVGGGYLAVGGRNADGPDVHIFKLEGGTPVRVDIDNFFRKYYFKPPNGYVSPSSFTPSYTSLSDVGLIEHNNRTYLIFSAEGLGDVYEIEAGEAIAANVVPNYFGTKNPNAATTDGPYYGDLLKFKATSNNSSASYSIDWNFGNPEAGTGVRQTNLNEEITHQYTGLNTENKIKAPKTVAIKATSDSSIASDLVVNLKVPTLRLGVPGMDPLTSATAAPFVVVAGDEFSDASDGAVEGHYTTWTIDGGTPVKAKPNAKIAAGALGSHTVAMSANYGAYDETNFSGTNPFTLDLGSVTYDVVPFTARILPPTATTNNLTFNAQARATSDRAILNATQWTVTWTLVNPGATVLGFEATETKTANVGTVPSFTVPKSTILNNSKVTLQISVPTTAVPLPIYASVNAEQKQVIPDPEVVKVSGCGNAGDPCSVKVRSKDNPSATIDWPISWSIKKDTTEVASGNSNPISFTPTAPGSYTATVTDTVFGKTANLTFTVAAALCGPVPITENVTISTDCGTDCQKDVDIEFSANIFQYSIQPCDTLSWDFGDNGKGTGDVVKHKFTSNGNYTVKFTIKNTSAAPTNTLTKSLAVKIGGGVIEPPPCVAPTAITFDWLGSKGCSPSKACEVGESVRFTGRRGASALLTCDTAQWNINGSNTSTKSPSHTFTATGTFTVSLVVSNTSGTSPSVSKSVSVVPSTASCTGSVPDVGLSVEYEGSVSNCFAGGSGLCQAGESIQFRPAFFGYTAQPCDRYEWDFGDGSAKSTLQEPTHTFADPVNRTVSLRMYNTNNPTGVTKTVDVLFSTAPIKQLPAIAFANPPASGAVGVPMTFNATSDINATGWLWNFGDDTGNNASQGSLIGKTSSLSHTFTKAGTFTVRVTARNAEETNTSRTNFALAVVTITESPEYRYLLPVVAHGAGQNNSVWRTDVQIYNPDPNVSDTNQLELKATFNGNDTTLRVAQSTYIFEDFMQRLTTSNNAQGAVILSTRAKYPPQIWTRTYNQTQNGTFGQFIPAIRLDAAGGGSAVGTGKYFLAGLRHNADYRTNLGFVNPNAQAITAHVVAYDDQGMSLGQFDLTLQPFVLLPLSITSANALPNLKGDRPFSLEITVPEGQWLLAYASSVDNDSGDPVYQQAIRQSELASPDYRDSFIPGVGRTGAWRSDVTVFNPHTRTVTVDLTFHDASGAVKGEAKNVPIDAGEFLQYDDLLRQGIFGSLADSVGVLRVTVPSTVPADFLPMTFARTYNDDGSGKTYGQFIGGFAASRANVKPGKPALITAVRNDPGKYYTNIGLTNVSGTAATVTAKVLDPNTGAEISSFSYSLSPFQSIVSRLSIGSFANASVKIEVTGGQVWAFGSQVDEGTKDPEYLAATPLP